MSVSGSENNFFPYLLIYNQLYTLDFNVKTIPKTQLKIIICFPWISVASGDLRWVYSCICSNVAVAGK